MDTIGDNFDENQTSSFAVSKNFEGQLGAKKLFIYFYFYLFIFFFLLLSSFFILCYFILFYFILFYLFIYFIYMGSVVAKEYLISTVIKALKARLIEINIW